MEFPSDMFLILEAVGAKLTIAENGTKNSVVSVADYLNVDMNRRIILNVILPALDQREYTFRSYKESHFSSLFSAKISELRYSVRISYSLLLSNET